MGEKEQSIQAAMLWFAEAMRILAEEELAEKAGEMKAEREKPKPPKGATCTLTDEDMAAIMAMNAGRGDSLEPAKLNPWSEAIRKRNAEDLESLLQTNPGRVTPMAPPDDLSEAARETESFYAEELAAAHWKYVDSLLAVHGLNERTRAAIGFHYRSAMVHGFKHGVEFALSEESGNNE